MHSQIAQPPYSLAWCLDSGSPACCNSIMSSQEPKKTVKPEVVNEPLKAGPVRPGAAKPSFKVTRSPLAAKARPVGVPRPPKRPAAAPSIATVPPILGRAPMAGGAAGKAAGDRKDTIPSSAPSAPLPTQTTKPKSAAAPMSSARPGNPSGTAPKPVAKKAAPKQETKQTAPMVAANPQAGGNVSVFAVDLLSALAAVIFTVFLATKL